MRKLSWLDRKISRILGKYTFTVLYSFFSTILFIIFYWNLMPARISNMFYYYTTDILVDPVGALVSVSMSPLLNDTPLHLAFVLALLLIAGAWFERSSGSERTVFVFYFSSISAAILGGYLLNGVHIGLSGRSWVEDAWIHGWAGGSAGMYGLAGGVAARVRKGWIVVLAALILESLVYPFYDVGYVAVFHMIGLLSGYLTSRYIMRKADK